VIAKKRPEGGAGGYHGIVLVPDVVERTPPFIDAVTPGSPAAKAGLKPDDLIVYVDGEQVASIKAWRDIMDKIHPGTTVKLEVRRVEHTDAGRTDKLMTVELKLEELKK